MMKKIWNWIWYSSADPKKVSLTVRASALALVPAALSIISASCGFGVVCLGVDQASLNQLIEYIVQAIEVLLAIVAGVGMLFGIVRKIYLSVSEWF